MSPTQHSNWEPNIWICLEISWIEQPRIKMGGKNPNKRHITNSLENINLELAHTLYIVGKITYTALKLRAQYLKCLEMPWIEQPRLKMGGRNQNNCPMTYSLDNINLDLAHTLYIVGMSPPRRSNWEPNTWICLEMSWIEHPRLKMGVGNKLSAVISLILLKIQIWS